MQCMLQQCLCTEPEYRQLHLVAARDTAEMHARLSWISAGAGPDGWAIKSNYPALDSGRVFRLDWFDLFLNFITLMLIVVALFTKVIHQVNNVVLAGSEYPHHAQMHCLPVDITIRPTSGRSMRDPVDTAL